MSADEQILGVEVSSGAVRPEWIDSNGHMNVAYYVLAFDWGIDELWTRFGITEEHVRDNQSSTFAVESRVLYHRELKLDDPYTVTSQILAFDEKRIHQFQRMYHSTQGFLAATAEWMSLHVDLNSRRVAPWPDSILNGIHDVAAAQADWLYPEYAGRGMRIAAPLFSIKGNSE